MSSKCVQHVYHEITVAAHSFFWLLIRAQQSTFHACSMDKSSIQWIVLKTEEVGVHAIACIIVSAEYLCCRYNIIDLLCCAGQQAASTQA